jgi:hypothetical protein
MDLQNELDYKSQLLYKAVEELKNTGKKYAEAYTKYRVELAKELVKLKDEGYAITLAGDIARGKPEIAKLKFDEISTEAVYKANQETINVLKLQIKILENQRQREWSSEEQ